jgi:hypothetical protein
MGNESGPTNALANSMTATASFSERSQITGKGVEHLFAIRSSKVLSDGPPKSTEGISKSFHNLSANLLHRSSSQCFCGRVVAGARTTNRFDSKPKLANFSLAV